MNTNERLAYFAKRAIQVEFRVQAGPDPKKCGSIDWISNIYSVPWQEFVTTTSIQESQGEALAAAMERARDHFERTKPHSSPAAK